MSQSYFGYRPYEPQLRLIPWGDRIWTVNGPRFPIRSVGWPFPAQAE
jgi:hypothetical protein